MARKYLIRYLPIAADDLSRILDYITHDSSTRARAFVDNLEQRIGQLAAHPQLGRVPRDLELRRSGYRLLVIEHYLVFYMVVGRAVVIHRVLHGSRLYEPLL